MKQQDLPHVDTTTRIVDDSCAHQWVHATDGRLSVCRLCSSIARDRASRVVRLTAHPDCAPALENEP